jgi:hypothetical protein
LVTFLSFLSIKKRKKVTKRFEIKERFNLKKIKLKKYIKEKFNLKKEKLLNILKQYCNLKKRKIRYYIKEKSLNKNNKNYNLKNQTQKPRRAVKHLCDIAFSLKNSIFPKLLFGKTY